MTHAGGNSATRPRSPVREAVREAVSEARRAERPSSAAQPTTISPEFLGFIAHELRNPMTVILGMSQLMATRTMDPAMYREVAADIAINAEILDGLLDSLLLLARPDLSAALAEPEPIILAATAAEAIETVRPRYPACSFSLDVADRGAIVEAPPMWVASAIRNLAANGAKYGGAEPDVIVRVEQEGELAVVRVLDRGPGFAEDEADRLFEPFFRSASVRQHAPGMGLGLAIVNQIVALLNGEAWARPRPGGGAEFGFALPSAKAASA